MTALLRRAASPLLAAGAGALIWLAWTEIGLLRGTPLWDLRFLVFGLAAIGALTAAEWIAGRLGPRDG